MAAKKMTLAKIDREEAQLVKEREAFSRRMGAHYRTQRERSGLSLREMARRLGCSASYLSDLERGRRTLNGDMIAKIGKALP